MLTKYTFDVIYELHVPVSLTTDTTENLYEHVVDLANTKIPQDFKAYYRDLILKEKEPITKEDLEGI